jgi:hypothetical protein
MDKTKGVFHMPLTKQQILAGLSERVTINEYVRALGGDVRIRELTRAQHRACVEQGKDPADPARLKTDIWHIALIAAGVVDDHDKPLFTFAELLPLTEGDDPPLRGDAAQALAQKILDLNEVGPNFSAATSSDLPATKA